MFFRYIIPAIFSLFILCCGTDGEVKKSFEQNKSDVPKLNPTTEDSVDIENLGSDTIPCPNNKEILMYHKNGSLLKITKDEILCSLVNDSTQIKSLFINCKMVYRSIKNISGAYSFAKYDKGKLIMYDSTNQNGDLIYLYDSQVQKVMYKGKVYKGNIELLPQYIQKEIKLDSIPNDIKN